MNGQPLHARFRQKSAVVDQNDIFVPTFNATETLRFHASLRMPHTEGMQCRVDEVLKCMGLWKCRHTQVGIEGYQRSVTLVICKKGMHFPCQHLANVQQYQMAVAIWSFFSKCLYKLKSVCLSKLGVSRSMLDYKPSLAYPTS